MGIADLFSSPEVKAKKFLNENEALILKHIDEYHKSKEFNKGTPYEAKDLLAYVKGSLLKEYLYQVDAKDKNQKYFFAEPFLDNTLNKQQLVYTIILKRLILVQGLRERLRRVYQLIHKECNLIKLKLLKNQLIRF